MDIKLNKKLELISKINRCWEAAKTVHGITKEIGISYFVKLYGLGIVGEPLMRIILRWNLIGRTGEKNADG